MIAREGPQRNVHEPARDADVIVRVTSAQDVLALIRFARVHGRNISVRTVWLPGKSQPDGRTERVRAGWRIRLERR